MQYNDYEALPKFVKKLQTKYPYLYNFLKNDLNIKEIWTHQIFETFPPNVITFYSKQEKDLEIKIIDVLSLEIPALENSDSIFFDWQCNTKEKDHSDALEAIKIKINGQFAGYYLRDLNTFVLTDWTHTSSLIDPAIKALSLLLDTLQLPKTKIQNKAIITSQKLKGIKLLTELFHSPPTIIVNDETMIPITLQNIMKKYDLLFIRTCPTNPRHGILENYIVPNNIETTKLAVQKLKMEMYSKGEYPQMVIQPFLYDSLNIVYNNGVLSLGIGNDGVTNKSKYTITLNNYKLDIEKIIKEKTQLTSFDLEFIYNYPEQKLYIVQIRKATAAKQIKTVKYKDCFEGFLPTNPVTIPDKEIVVIEDLSNLDTLEKIQRPRNIICAHVQGNILSHAAAWCRQKNIPYIIIDNPKELTKYKYIYEIEKGILKLTKDQIKIDDLQIEQESYDQNFLDGFHYGLNNFEHSSLFGWETYFYFQLFASGVVNTKPCAILAGIFVGFLINTILMLAYGELRHLNHQAESSREFYKFVCQFMKTAPFPPNIPRDFIYQIFCDLKLDLEKKKQLSNLFDIAFNKISWESSNYGGPKWGAPFADNFLTTLMETTDMKKLIIAANKLLNLAHNGGWYFDKFLNNDFLDIVYNKTLSFGDLEYFVKGFSYLKKYLQNKEEI